MDYSSENRAKNKLKDIREELNIKQTDVVSGAKSAIDESIDVPLLSKIEHGICLPTKPLLKFLCVLYGTTPKQVYKNGSLSLASCLNLILKSDNTYENQFYQFKARISKDYAGLASDERLHVCGYKTRAQFVEYCLDQLDEQYKKEVARRKASERSHQNIA